MSNECDCECGQDGRRSANGPHQIVAELIDGLQLNDKVDASVRRPRSNFTAASERTLWFGDGQTNAFYDTCLYTYVERRFVDSLDRCHVSVVMHGFNPSTREKKRQQNASFFAQKSANDREDTAHKSNNSTKPNQNQTTNANQSKAIHVHQHHGQYQIQHRHYNRGLGRC